MNKMQFLKAVERECERIDTHLERFLKRDDVIENLDDALLYQLGLDVKDRKIRGKRIRPVLCLLTCRILGGDQRKAMPFALGIELMHNFCLIHDDIEDGDRMRRHRPSLWVKNGIAHGINSGDYMFCKVWEVLLSGGKDVLSSGQRLNLMELMSTTLDHTHRGQALDINARDKIDFSVDDYFTLATQKTGYYLAAPMIGGAMVAGVRKSLLEKLLEFGLLVGPLFQIVDDAIDMTEGKGRDARGSDIREGKRSYLVALAGERANKQERARLFRILNKSREKTTDRDVAWVIDLFEKHDVIVDSLKTAADFKERALAEIEDTPPRLRSMLTIFAELMVERKQ